MEPGGGRGVHMFILLKLIEILNHHLQKLSLVSPSMETLNIQLMEL